MIDNETYLKIREQWRRDAKEDVSYTVAETETMKCIQQLSQLM